ncbi:MAG: MFS transporter [Dehalococcoidia bacterium]|nr:MAG: MFS transporter [Dehalococcoidia bacterium]
MTIAEEARTPAAPAGARPTGFLLRRFESLSNRYFRLLFIGNLAQFGSMQMQQLVRGVLVFQLTGSFAALGLVSMANAIPGLVFAPIGGVVADRAPKKTVIQLGQSYNMLNAAVLAVLAGTGLLRIEHLMISAVLQGAVNSVMMPSRQSIISDLVGRERLMNAIGMNTSGQNLMQLAGPALGGLLLALISPAAVFWVMAGLYAAAVTFTVRLPKRPMFAYEGRRGRRRGSLSDLVEGVQYVARDPSIRTLILVNFIIVLATQPYQMMLPGFVREVLQKGPAEQGVLMTLTGVGALAGSFVVASLTERNRGRVLLTVAAMAGVALIAFATSTNYYITMPIMLVVGATQATRMSLGQVLIQSYSEDEFRGRVMSVWFMQFSLVQVGTFVVGILAEVLGPRLAIGGLAAGMLVALAIVTAFVPRMRTLQ